MQQHATEQRRDQHQTTDAEAKAREKQMRALVAELAARTTALERELLGLQAQLHAADEEAARAAKACRRA